MEEREFMTMTDIYCRDHCRDGPPTFTFKDCLWVLERIDKEKPYIVIDLNKPRKETEGNYILLFERKR